MKFVFIDKSDKECDIITDVLSSYNILYKVHTNRTRQMFSTYLSYDVEIDVEPAFYEYLCKEIQPKLDTLQLLEDCYDLPAYKKAEDVLDELFKTPAKPKTTKSNGLGEMLVSALSRVFDCEDSEYEDSDTLVQFDDLPDEIKLELLKRMPESMLRSKNCRIRKTPIGLSITFIGSDDE